MAAPIDSALYRMKAYGKLLQENGAHAGAAHDPGDDILALVEWIEYARPLLGAISPDQVMSQVQNQAQVMPPEPKPAPKPEDDEPNAPEPPPPAEAPTEDKPVA